ncbi:hypothetical protein HK101_011502 [Irineochytrium annulatum]|nr:hypothetical protein HK101_011502 [Irineochytrium annulatum]
MPPQPRSPEVDNRIDALCSILEDHQLAKLREEHMRLMDLKRRSLDRLPSDPEKLADRDPNYRPPEPEPDPPWPERVEIPSFDSLLGGKDASEGGSILAPEHDELFIFRMVLGNALAKMKEMAKRSRHLYFLGSEYLKYILASVYTFVLTAFFLLGSAYDRLYLKFPQYRSQLTDDDYIALLTLLYCSKESAWREDMIRKVRARMRDSRKILQLKDLNQIAYEARKKYFVFNSQALSFLDDLRLDGYAPDADTYRILISALGAHGDTAACDALFRKAMDIDRAAHHHVTSRISSNQELSDPPAVRVVTPRLVVAAMVAHARDDNTTAMLKYHAIGTKLGFGRHPDIIAVLMDAHNKAGEHAAVLDLYDSFMQRTGRKPTNKAENARMLALIGLRRVEEAMEAARKVWDCGGIRVHTINALLAALCEVDRGEMDISASVDEVKGWADAMGRDALWHVSKVALLRFHRQRGDTKRALDLCSVFEKELGLTHDVLAEMGHVYLDAGRHGDAMGVVEVARNKGRGMKPEVLEVVERYWREMRGDKYADDE